MAKRLSWAERIDRAEKRGWFTKTDRALAGEWRSCALGERMNFPRSSNYISSIKSSDSIYPAGLDFCRAVEDDNFTEARLLYHEIQTMPMETT